LPDPHTASAHPEPFSSTLPRRTPPTTLFPYTTPFRSSQLRRERRGRRRARARGDRQHGTVRARRRRIDGASRGDRPPEAPSMRRDRKSTRLNSSHVSISYAVFCLKKKNRQNSIWSHTT